MNTISICIVVFLFASCFDVGFANQQTFGNCDGFPADVREIKVGSSIWSGQTRVINYQVSSVFVVVSILTSVRD